MDGFEVIGALQITRPSRPGWLIDSFQAKICISSKAEPSNMVDMLPWLDASTVAAGPAGSGWQIGKQAR